MPRERSEARRPDSGEVKKVIVGRGGPRPAYHEDPETGCWISTGASQGGEYRMMDSKPAHRAAYEVVEGPIFPAFEIHHLCRRGACINPEHIIALPRRDHHKLHRYERQRAGHRV